MGEKSSSQAQEIIGIIEDICLGEHQRARSRIGVLGENSASESLIPVLERGLDLVTGATPEKLDRFIDVQTSMWTTNRLLELSWDVIGLLKYAHTKTVSNLTRLSERYFEAEYFSSSIQISDSVGISLLEHAFKASFRLSNELHDLVFTDLCVPVAKMALQTRRHSFLLAAEITFTMKYVKVRESERQFNRAWSQMAIVMQEAGRQFASDHALPDLCRENADSESTQRKSIAFLVARLNKLAHIQVMKLTLDGYRKQENQPFDPIVVVLQHACDSEVEAELNALGVRVVSLFPHGFQGRDLSEIVLRVRSSLVDLKVDAVAYVSWVNWCVFLSAMGIAPKHIWWSLKFHQLRVPEIDGYVTGGWDLFREIHGQAWRGIKPGLPDLVDEAFRPNASEIRAALPSNCIVLGTLGRGEKIRSTEFLSAVCNILVDNPQAVFLWTGTSLDAAVESSFKKAGVLERTQFIGWVETKIYARVLDIFLDSFPNPCGVTLFQSMAVGVPAVVMREDESSLGLQNSLKKLYDGVEGTPEEVARVAQIFRKREGGSVYPVANNLGEYEKKASRLIRDERYRRDCGSAGQAYINEFMSDNVRMGESFAYHFSEILEC